MGLFTSLSRSPSLCLGFILASKHRELIAQARANLEKTNIQKTFSNVEPRDGAWRLNSRAQNFLMPSTINNWAVVNFAEDSRDQRSMVTADQVYIKMWIAKDQKIMSVLGRYPSVGVGVKWFTWGKMSHPFNSAQVSVSTKFLDTIKLPLSSKSPIFSSDSMKKVGDPL